MLHVVSTAFHLFDHPFPYVNEIQPYINVFIAKNRKPQPAAAAARRSTLELLCCSFWDIFGEQIWNFCLVNNHCILAQECHNKGHMCRRAGPGRCRVFCKIESFGCRVIDFIDCNKLFSRQLCLLLNIDPTPYLLAFQPQPAPFLQVLFIWVRDLAVQSSTLPLAGVILTQCPLNTTSITSPLTEHTFQIPDII